MTNSAKPIPALITQSLIPNYLIPNHLTLNPQSLLPNPQSLISTPYSLLPTPYSLITQHYEPSNLRLQLSRTCRPRKILGRTQISRSTSLGRAI
ncbi:MAG: hypothetical protein B6I38_03890 [Anaerolineaceae bacterium 4572_5.1]|nr:MAG: hypothetical protein B6I38_03890 [Anaerolineaceae bacterium 4572_5.1]